MKLETEPRLGQGPQLYPTLLDILRKIAQAVNPMVDQVASQATQITALQTGLVTGEFRWFALGSAPAGWVQGNGTTIGNVGSGATRASVDTLALFTAWWGFTDGQLPILTSAGAASTRGVSAAADWAALKRMTVFDVRDRFIRAGGLTYAIGGKYAATEVFDNFGNLGSVIVAPATGAGVVNGDGAGGVVNNWNQTTPIAGFNTTSVQTQKVRPLNIALLGCFKL